MLVAQAWHCSCQRIYLDALAQSLLQIYGLKQHTIKHCNHSTCALCITCILSLAGRLYIPCAIPVHSMPHEAADAHLVQHCFFVLYTVRAILHIRSAPPLYTSVLCYVLWRRLVSVDRFQLNPIQERFASSYLSKLQRQHCDACFMMPAASSDQGPAIQAPPITCGAINSAAVNPPLVCITAEHHISRAYGLSDLLTTITSQNEKRAADMRAASATC